MIVHGGLVATLRAGVWRGILIRGPSGIGKSDLAVRLMASGFRLVADDRVLLFASQGKIFGRAPKALDGLVEVRGLGVLAVDSLRLCRIAMVVDCAPSSQVERMPDAAECTLLGVSVPCLNVCPTESSAPAKLCRAMEVLGRVRQEAYDPAFPRGAHSGSTRRSQS